MQELTKGIILKRYKRFFCDLELPGGEKITAHTPNTGTMKSCLEPGWTGLVTYHDDPKRKLKWTLEMTVNPEGHSIMVNTSRSNRLVEEALQSQRITDFGKIHSIQREVKVGRHRLDFKVESEKGNYFIEVKNVTLLQDGRLQFPDAKSVRALEHVQLLQELKGQGEKTAMFFLISRQDGELFSPAVSIHPEYALALTSANKAGVLMLAYRLDFSSWPPQVKNSVEIQL